MPHQPVDHTVGPDNFRPRPQGGGVNLTWRQELVLRAAASVDCIPLRYSAAESIPHGVFRSLVMAGYLRDHPHGWAITPEGREIIGEVVIHDG